MNKNKLIKDTLQTLSENESPEDTVSTTYSFKLDRPSSTGFKSPDSSIPSERTVSSKKTTASSKKTTRSVKISQKSGYISQSHQSDFVGQMSVAGLDPYAQIDELEEDEPDIPDESVSVSLSKSVHAPWYRRYAHVLREDERVLFQPKSEIAHDEADSAMRHVFGKYYKQELALELSDETVKLEMQIRAIKQYRRAKAVMVKPPPATSLLSASPKARGTLKAFTLCKQIQRLWQKNLGIVRESIGSESRWSLFKSLKAKAYFKEEGQAIKKLIARRRFQKVIKTILHIKSFIRVLIGKHYSVAVKLSELPDLSDAMENDEQNMHINTQSKSITLFEPGHYKSCRSDDTNVPLPIVMLLNKPWFARTVQEVGDVVKYLYSRWVYHNYPMKVQMQMAHVAWYTRIKKQRPIVREDNPATRFFILLSGQIELTEFVRGNENYPDIPPKTKLIKHINKGDRFGDERMNINNRIRWYSANSTTICEILAIDYGEYQENILTDDTRTHAFPPHITFIKSLPLFKSFSQSDLLRSAKAKLIQLFYFTMENVVATSLDHSDYIFVVLFGECHTVFEHNSAKAREGMNDYGRSTANGGLSRILQQGDVGADTKCHLSKLLSRDSLLEKKEIDSFKFLTSNTTQDFVREIRHISETSLDFSKEDLIKQIQQIKLLKLIASVYGHKCSSHVAAELVERMHLHERAIDECQEEIEKIRAKTLKFKKKLFRARQQMDDGSAMKELVDKASCSLSTPLYGSDTSVRPMPNSTTKSKVQAPESDTVSTQTTPRSPLNVNRNKNKSVVGTQTDSIELPKEDGIDEDKINDFDNAETPGHPESRTSYAGSPSAVLMKVNTDPSQTSRTAVSQFSDLPFSSPRLEDSTSSQRGTLSFQKSTTYEDLSSSQQLTPMSLHRPVQYSLPVDKFVKGDVIGNDYMDYNDGKYRRPELDFALISDGAELVMIAKTFLIDRLYNHHRKFMKLPPMPDDDHHEEHHGDHQDHHEDHHHHH